MESRSSTSTSTRKKNAVQSTLLKINYLNLICDTTVSFLINVINVTDTRAIIFGVICVIVRLIVKLMQIKFNYKRYNRLKGFPVMPATWANKFYFFVCFVGCVISISVLFYNKIFSLRTIVKKMGDSTFLNVLIFVVAIWAVLTSINSLFPAFWFNISKATAKEGKYVFHDGVFRETDFSDSSIKTGKFFRVSPYEEKINICNNIKALENFLNPKDSQEESKLEKQLKINVDNEPIFQWSLQGNLFYKKNNEEFWRRVKKLTITDQSAIIKSFKASVNETEDLAENLDKTKIHYEENNKKVLSNWWSVRFFFRSVNVKILISFIDFLADLPFAIFTMHFSDLDPAIILFLKVCLPLGLIESMFYTLTYFSDDSYRDKIIVKENVSKKARFFYYALISCAYISAFSKVFVKVIPMYHICYNIIHNKIVSAFLAFIFSYLYMCRNIANLYNAQEKGAEKVVMGLIDPNSLQLRVSGNIIR